MIGTLQKCTLFTFTSHCYKVIIIIALLLLLLLFYGNKINQFHIYQF